MGRWINSKKKKKNQWSCETEEISKRNGSFIKKSRCHPTKLVKIEGAGESKTQITVIKEKCLDYCCRYWNFIHVIL